MKRNVILMGGKTYVLSLPSQWIKKYQVQKGDELDVEEQDDSIVIRTERKKPSREIELDCSQLTCMLGRTIGAIYKAGYSRAKIHFQTKEQLQKIEETLQRTLVGFEIVKQEKNYLVIESLADMKTEEFDPSLKRLFYSLEIMSDDLFFALSTHNIQALQKVIEKDGQNNRLADFCRRVLNSGDMKSTQKAPVLYHIVEQLERIGDAYKDLARFSLTFNTPSPASLSLFKEIQALFLQYRVLFYKFDLGGFEDFGKQFYALREKFQEPMSRSSLEERVFVVHLYHLLELIIDMNGALLTLHL